MDSPAPLSSALHAVRPGAVLLVLLALAFAGGFEVGAFRAAPERVPPVVAPVDDVERDVDADAPRRTWILTAETNSHAAVDWHPRWGCALSAR